MRSGAIVWMLVAAVGGGCSPFQVVTHDRVVLDAPVVTSSRVTLDLAPVRNGGPVVAMPVRGGPCAGQGRKVALIDVDGLLVNTDLTGLYSLGENPVALFREKLDAIAADPGVAAVVVRINSPGGSVTATDVMWHDLQAFRAATRRPVVACFLDLGTGGGYYLAMAADLVLAHPTTVTGGIGVILNLYNLRDAMRYFNIIEQPIRAGPNIDMGSPVQKLSPEAEQLLQAMADEFHERFQRVVRQARPAVDGGQGTTFDGRVFTARQALQRRLIDRIGYLDDAIAAAEQLAGLDNAPVVLYHRESDPARSTYAVTPNSPLQAAALPLSLPGLDRSRLPTFLYLWQPEATLEKLGGR
jgi:protease-4